MNQLFLEFQIVLLGIIYLLYVHRYDIRSFFRYNFPWLFRNSLIKMTEEIKTTGMYYESEEIENIEELPEIFFDVSFNIDDKNIEFVFVKIDKDIYFDLDTHIEEGGKKEDLDSLLKIKEYIADLKWD